MTTTPFTLTIHMVQSLDGMIAKKDNSIAWFDTQDVYENGVTGQDPAEFLKTIECNIMGSHTYQHALELSKNYGWAHGETPTIVTTSRNLPIERPNIETYNGDLTKLVNEYLKPRYKNVWLAGGPTLANEFIQQNLANEIRISILPIILSDGIPFFQNLNQEHPLHLKEVTAYKNGMVELWYEVRKG